MAFKYINPVSKKEYIFDTKGERSDMENNVRLVFVEEIKEQVKAEAQPEEKAQPKAKGRFRK